jgi:hypothetical protein
MYYGWCFVTSLIIDRPPYVKSDEDYEQITAADGVV